MNPLPRRQFARLLGAAAVVIVGRVLAKRQAAAAGDKETVIELPADHPSRTKQGAA